MKKSKRRNYTDEFKEEAVKLVTKQHYKITEVARNLVFFIAYSEDGSR